MFHVKHKKQSIVRKAYIDCFLSGRCIRRTSEPSEPLEPFSANDPGPCESYYPR